jgi:hypothetical protein
MDRIDVALAWFLIGLFVGATICVIFFEPSFSIKCR